MEEWERIELINQDEIEEILGKTPSWITKSGLLIIFLLLLTLVIGSCFFKYPETIIAPVIVLSENPPIRIVSQIDGKIDKLFVSNEQEVKQGDLLAIMENTANYYSVCELKEKITLIEESYTSENISDNDILPYFTDLGIIQKHYSYFYSSFNNYKNYLKVGIHNNKISKLRNKIIGFTKLKKQLNKKSSKLERISILNKNQYERDSILFGINGITIEEFERSEQAYLQSKLSYENLLESLLTTQIQIRDLKYEVKELKKQKYIEKQKLLNTLIESFENLNLSIDEWTKKYCLISPIDGKVSFKNIWVENQNVSYNEDAFVVVPNITRNIIGRAKLPISNSGKIEIGQKVYIKLENFPYTEFGQLIGVIKSISLTPEVTNDGAYYTAEISLKNNMETNYKFILPMNQEMRGTAEITTKDITLAMRFLYPIKAVLNKSIMTNTN